MVIPPSPWKTFSLYVTCLSSLFRIMNGPPFTVINYQIPLRANSPLGRALSLPPLNCHSSLVRQAFLRKVRSSPGQNRTKITFNLLILLQEGRHRLQGNPGGQLFGKAINPGTDVGKGDGRHRVFDGQR